MMHKLFFALLIPWLVLESLNSQYTAAHLIISSSGIRNKLGIESSLKFSLENSQDDLEKLWYAEGNEEDKIDEDEFSSFVSLEERDEVFHQDSKSLPVQEACFDGIKMTSKSATISHDSIGYGWKDSRNSDIKAKSSMRISQTTNIDLNSPKSRRRRISKSSEYWNFHLELIQDYKMRFGHIDVPYSYAVTVGDKLVKLGTFLYWLRSLYAKELLRVTVPFQFAKELTELGMKWDFLGKGRRHQLFLNRLNEWKDMTSQEGRMKPALRTWMWRQRYQYKRYCDGLSSTLTQDRIDLLTDVGIVPFQRPLQAVQYIWDESWNNNLKKWITWKDRKDIVDMSQDLFLWAWEQWRMYDILRGETPYKGDLPVLWTGYRVKDLQDANFFGHERSYFSYPPPDVKLQDISIDWNELISAVKKYFSEHGDINFPLSCELSVGDYPLVFLTARLIMESKIFQFDLCGKQDFLLLDEDRMKEIKEAMPYVMNANMSPLSSDIEWWYHYHQCKQVRRDDVKNVCLSVATLSWIGEQQQRIWLLQEPSNGNSTILSEVQYEALRCLGTRFEFPSIDELPASRSACNNVVGRPPAILDLNHDVLPDEALLLRKHMEKLEDMTWKFRYRDLCSFVKAHGHCSVSPSVDPKLALWTKNQRQQYQKSIKGMMTPLNEERKQLLLAINFDFGINQLSRNTEEEFDRMILALRGFKAVHGHCFVPLSLPSNPSLGDWINRQRKDFMQRELSPEKVKELRTVGLELELPDAEYYQMAYDTLWQERISECQQFLDRHQGGWKELLEMKSVLSAWAKEQHQLYHLRDEFGVPSLMTPERIHKLENLNFPFDRFT
jgi:Helicase associated domain